MARAGKRKKKAEKFTFRNAPGRFLVPLHSLTCDGVSALIRMWEARELVSAFLDAGIDGDKMCLFTSGQHMADNVSLPNSSQSRSDCNRLFELVHQALDTNGIDLCMLHLHRGKQQPAAYEQASNQPHHAMAPMPAPFDGVQGSTGHGYGSPEKWYPSQPLSQSQSDFQSMRPEFRGLPPIPVSRMQSTPKQAYLRAEIDVFYRDLTLLIQKKQVQTLSGHIDKVQQEIDQKTSEIHRFTKKLKYTIREAERSRKNRLTRKFPVAKHTAVQVIVPPQQAESMASLPSMMMRSGIPRLGDMESSSGLAEEATRGRILESQRTSGSTTVTELGLEAQAAGSTHTRGILAVAIAQPVVAGDPADDPAENLADDPPGHHHHPADHHPENGEIIAFNDMPGRSLELMHPTVRRSKKRHAPATAADNALPSRNNADEHPADSLIEEPMSPMQQQTTPQLGPQNGLYVPPFSPLRHDPLEDEDNVDLLSEIPLHPQALMDHADFFADADSSEFDFYAMSGEAMANHGFCDLKP